jgi:hypothetical protein
VGELRSDDTWGATLKPKPPNPMPVRSRSFEEDPLNFTQSGMGFYKDEFEQHPDITSTRGWTPEFLHTFRQAYQAYEAGHWGDAQVLLEETKVRSQTRSSSPPACERVGWLGGRT